MSKNFSIFKNTHKKEGSTAPDYKMSMKIGEEYIEIGACWLKEGKSGKFFSCKLSDVYVDHTKGVARKGFVINEEPSNGKDMPKMVEEVDTQEIPF